MTTPREYEKPEGDPNLGENSTRDLRALGDHIVRHWGEPKVFHELMSDYVHIDLHVVPADNRRRYHTVITTGMSDRPMKVPAGNEAYRFAELLLCLPPSWPLEKESFKEERFWWPFRHLKQTARFPHVFETWLWNGHTVANENPPQPFADDVGFSGLVLMTPILCAEEACTLQVRPDKKVFFFSLIPLYENELRFAWEEGSTKLLDLLDEANVSELINPGRENLF